MINRVEFEPDAIEDLDQVSPVIRDRILYDLIDSFLTQVRLPVK